jgi:hypothetical protein
MTVSELITELKKHDGDLMVVVAGYEDGLDDVRQASPVQLKLNHFTTWYYGAHKEVDEGGTPAIELHY